MSIRSMHSKSKIHAPNWLKILAVYAFAMTAAVACGQFEVNKGGKETAKGVAAVVRDGNTGAATSQTLSISNVTRKQLGDADGYPTWSLQVQFNHGNRAVSAEVFPTVNSETEEPTSDVAIQTNGTMTYTISGICGDGLCNKYAVLLTVSDSSNGQRGQIAEYLDTRVIPALPKRSTGQNFSTVWAAYETLSGESLKYIGVDN